MMRDKAEPLVHVDNDRVRVVEWQFTPGAETGVHTHDHDYVIVPVTAGVLRIENPDGTVTRAELAAGRAYFRTAGVTHNVVNDGPGPLAFVEIEWLGGGAA